MTEGPIKGTLFILAHLHVICPTIVAHPTCVFLSLADDTHIVGSALNEVFIF
jgi:hypothetical protein